jgi:hypothetical protein
MTHLRLVESKTYQVNRPAWSVPPTWVTVHCTECGFRAIRQTVDESIARIEAHGIDVHGWVRPTDAA